MRESSERACLWRCCSLFRLLKTQLVRVSFLFSSRCRHGFPQVSVRVSHERMLLCVLTARTSVCEKSLECVEQTNCANLFELAFLNYRFLYMSIDEPLTPSGPVEKVSWKLLHPFQLVNKFGINALS